MKPVNEIYAEFLLGNVKFHKLMEHDIFRDSLMFHMDNKYSSSATLCAVLYEMLFTTRLVRETSNPSGFVPNKENMEQQLENLIKREDEVINKERLSFRDITQQLVDKAVLTTDEKSEYDTFYTNIRNPVAHGLTSRLFEPMLGRTPKHAFETDTNYNAIYHKASEILIDKIYYLMAVKGLRKQ
jgi:hypothetical protein